MPDRGAGKGGSAGMTDFRALMDAHQAKVRSTCYRFVQDVDAADDLAQDVFLQAYEALPSFRGEAEVSTWLYRIAVNLSLDYLRRRKRRAFLLSLLPWPRMTGDEKTEVPSSDADPHTALEQNELRVILHKAIDGLPESQRIALVLDKFEGFGNREIAAILDITVPAVESLLHRAKKNLRERLYLHFENSSEQRMDSAGRASKRRKTR